MGTIYSLEGKAIKYSARTPVITRRTLIGATTFSAIVILTIVGYLLVREYRNTEEDAKRSALNIVQLISRDIRTTFSTYDSALINIADLLHSQVLSTLPVQTQHALLFDRTSEAPSSGGFFVLDAQGKLIAHSQPGVRVPANALQQPWFTAHQHTAVDDLYISHPQLANADSNEWIILLSRRLPSPDGAFAGVVVGQLKMSYFQNLFRGLDIGPSGNISLLDTDGTLMMQYPATSKIAAGQDLSQAPNFKRFLNERYGGFIAMSAIYHHERLYNFAQVHDLPMIVVVAVAASSIFSNWQHTALLIGSVTLLLCLGLSWLTWLLLRELSLRHLAERDLATLASTDPLTGLANRRTLDRTLDLEWRRAQRSGCPLSLVMIDIDHFKAFNDDYGHQAGDEALRQVAQAIEAHVRRPGDLAARYGGEEFAVVLSETEAAGTRVLCEKIRLAVEQMPAVLPDHKKLTISLGSCTRYAKPGETPDALLSVADKALYQAKNTGRNRVVNINETGLNALKPPLV
ncbi:diguanylate cyclase [Pseudomonas sp. 7P_10.2_Bac1]|uniref:sensor domain-containing diguanylate cyclase n=1 Tax=Pseudomonas sp. 7P_10.2_Bac1 TaxID=2971614 RepID=UPI0021C93412|nr:sensor domain-containing diguanylate cyclase [Pseudomonas sp. 7P_10.2_Bac1]MCU1725859.1 diguanylate cyclase [Pseudomonas sp. 7P_10.2_Bac1]